MAEHVSMSGAQSMESHHNSGGPSSGANMMDSRNYTQAPSILNNFDFSAINDLDPSLCKHDDSSLTIF